ncbi:prolyl oligopeptidase family serine peptidase [Haloechinothrix sp. LS1_15]|uniref:prolyl oligopeptidase family serine peptidase n=1 Tax=Haloechinothrix sp. LS1_15 TaxID=2652248 RepID=UPI002946BC34|nr:prolyl oligopeptidase family serine peptidase [Haloechinothrix sp. LS1_15]MDV6014294.1 prolyl oligopeptidase family serine peptidase [Haloechinothrix sp. LS1_15]
MPGMRRLPRLSAAVLAGLLAAGLAAPVATAEDGAAGPQAGPEASAAEPPEVAPDVADSLPAVDSGALPGPEVLYDEAPEAPQLENRDARFAAEPLLVAGTEAYVDGEYLYQDHIFDDYGADTDGTGADGSSARHGNFDYPTNEERYAGNAADLVEFRVAPGTDEVAYRITLNTLLEPDSTIVAIAFDTDGDETTGSDTLPRDPGAPFPGTDEVITTWGTDAEHTRFGADGAEQATIPVEVDTDVEAAQLTVTVPREVSDPSGSWRATVATGLHDPDTGGWLRPQHSADENTPGGAGPVNPEPSGIVNLAFRFDEPVVERSTPPDTAQAEALRENKPTRFAHELDFDALAAGDNRSTVPEHGTMVRIFPSRLDVGQGQRLDDSPPSADQDSGTFPAYRSQLQPYSLYVPSSEAPHGFTLNMHSLGQRHWQYNGSAGTRQLGEDRDHVVATPLARGTDGWYQHEAAYDVFEVWNDVARHHDLDPERAASAGYSMGGYGTYRLATRFPDLFGAAFTTVAPPGEGIWVPPAPPSGGAETLTNTWLANARNVPFLNVVATADQLVPIVGPRAQNLGAPELGIDGFDQFGYRFSFVNYAADHLTLAALDYDIPMATGFLGDAEVDRDPPRVTFVAVPAADDAELGLVADHAYWVSEVTVADDADGEVAAGTVDVTSRGFGVGEPETVREHDAGVEPLPYTAIGRSWQERPEIEVANRLDVTLTDVVAATIDVDRARLDPEVILTVPVEAADDGELLLDGRFPQGTRILRDGHRVGMAGRDGATLPVVAGESEFVLVPPTEASRWAR